MKHQIKTLVAGGLLALALFGTAMAGPLEDAKAAYEKNDYATALLILRPLADRGNAEAQSRLGVMYANGLGVPLDNHNAQAVVWFRKAADQGNAEAQLYLGDMYREGLGVPKDLAQAIAWDRMAANQGYALGQLLVGDMYRDGHGVPQNHVLAHMWYNLAASHGEDPKFRDDIAAKMTPAQIAEAERMASEWKPSGSSR